MLILHSTLEIKLWSSWRAKTLARFEHHTNLAAIDFHGVNCIDDPLSVGLFLVVGKVDHWSVLHSLVLELPETIERIDVLDQVLDQASIGNLGLR